MNKDRHLRAKTLLAAQLAHEPCFNQLRTKEQLGYIVRGSTYTSLRRRDSRCSYKEAASRTSLASLGNILEVDETKFEEHKVSLINKVQEKSKNLAEETNNFWRHILSEEFDFEQCKLSHS
jgi:insulysin